MTNFKPEIDPNVDLGAAWQRLNERERAFVMYIVTKGDNDHTAAVRAAGFKCATDNATRVQAHRLWHKKDIQEAIAERTRESLAASGPMIVRQLMHLAYNARKESDQLKAIEMVANRIGLHAVHETHVKTEDVSMGRAALEQRLKELLANNPQFNFLLPPGFDIEMKPEPAPALPAPAQEEDDW